eukprot:UN11142
MYDLHRLPNNRFASICKGKNKMRFYKKSPLCIQEICVAKKVTRFHHFSLESVKNHEFLGFIFHFYSNTVSDHKSHI